MSIDLPVLTAAWLAGLMGGLHCAAMCGGIATGFSAVSTRTGWRAAATLNLGRVAGYVLAGALVGGLGHFLLRAMRLEVVTVGLRMLVGLVLMVVALRLLDRRGRLALLGRPGARLWRGLRPLQQALLPADTGWKRFGAGMLWGWLPCGLSTTLLAAAWLQANARDAALTMAAFGLGTLPVMLPLTWTGQRLSAGLHRPAVRIPAAGLGLAAGALTMASPWLMKLPALHGALPMLGCRPGAA